MAEALQAEVRWPEELRHGRLGWSEKLHGGWSPTLHGGDAASTDGRADARGGRVAAGAGLEFFVGPNGSGIPMHFHGPVWNTLVWGRKLWVLQPPARARFAPAQQHPLDSRWLEHWRASRRGAVSDSSTCAAQEEGGQLDAGGHVEFGAALFCEQQPGEAIYVPSGWAHATLSLAESFGVGGFLHEELSLGLHMQLQHAPRGIGSLQNAAHMHDEWYELVSRAFPTQSR